MTDILGVGMHKFGRFPDEGLKDLARVATLEALKDAHLDPADIDAVYSANSLAGLLTGQEQVRGQTVLRDVGIEGVPVVNVENACASGSTALREAIMAVRSGSAKTVLALGFEKMFVADRDATLSALRSAADLDVVAGLGLQFTAVYAMRLRSLIDDGQLSESDLIDVTIKAHANGAKNPYAQFQQEVSQEEVANSRKIADPLTLLMCSAACDGAAAVVVGETRPSGAHERRVRVRASVLRSGRTLGGENLDSVATRAATEAYESAGVGPEDLDVLEVHDAMAPGELLYYEQLGLCPRGAAAEFFRTGATRIGGKQPVNPSGGLSSRGHPVGATGLAQIAELTWQLRGTAGARQVREPRLALAQNSGGWLEGDSAACNVHILEGLSA